MKKIVIIGTGAVAAELTSYLEDSSWGENKCINIKGYLTSDYDGEINWKKYHFKSPYLGTLDNYIFSKDDYFVLAFSNSTAKSKIASIIKSKGGNFITLIHPTATIASTAQLGEGNILSPYTIIGPNVKIGNFNLLTSQTIISHDSIVGNFNFFASALLCGHNIVGDNNFFGIRSTTIPEISVGDRNVIQAGMILNKNIGNDSTIFYRYKEKVIALPKSAY